MSGNAGNLKKKKKKGKNWAKIQRKGKSWMFLAFTTIKERSTPDSRPHEYKGRPQVKEGAIGGCTRERAWKYDWNKGGQGWWRFWSLRSGPC